MPVRASVASWSSVTLKFSPMVAAETVTRSPFWRPRVAMSTVTSTKTPVHGARPSSSWMMRKPEVSGSLITTASMFISVVRPTKGEDADARVRGELHVRDLVDAVEEHAVRLLWSVEVAPWLSVAEMK